jgi:hypothetical protein
LLSILDLIIPPLPEGEGGYGFFLKKNILIPKITEKNILILVPSFVYYRNNQIQNVSEYPFLGITLKSNGNLSHRTTDLVKNAKKA